MTSQTSSQLRQALIKQTQVWQPLVLHQQSLQDFTMSYVTQRIWNDFMQEFEQATSKGVFNTVEKNFRKISDTDYCGHCGSNFDIGFPGISSRTFSRSATKPGYDLRPGNWECCGFLRYHRR